jgi:putative redox protein
VEIQGDAPAEELERLVRRVDEIAEIPNSLRAGTAVTLTATRVGGDVSG